MNTTSARHSRKTPRLPKVILAIAYLAVGEHIISFARTQVQRALEIDPNHLGAQALPSSVLLMAKQWGHSFFAGSRSRLPALPDCWTDFLLWPLSPKTILLPMAGLLGLSYLATCLTVFLVYRFYEQPWLQFGRRLARRYPP